MRTITLILHSSLPVAVLFEAYHIQSQEASNTINLELPLAPLLAALKSALQSSEASLRLTKRDGIPVLSMTIHTTTETGANGSGGNSFGDVDTRSRATSVSYNEDANLEAYSPQPLELAEVARLGKEKVVTQDIPVRVLHPETVEQLMQPKVREPDVHVQLPPLLHLKAVSDRFTRLAAAGRASPKLELQANMHGGLRLRVRADGLDLCSEWSGLENPDLDPAQLDMPIAEHPSTAFREAGPGRWASVRVDAKDWSRVLSVGRLEGRVIACFADEHALILYVYVPHFDDASAEDSVVTVSTTSLGCWSMMQTVFADLNGSITSRHTALDMLRGPLSI
jgi:HUS1 checkpoint protein